MPADMNAVVRRVRPDDWRAVRAIRLEMLIDTPMAYITTYAEADGFPDAIWIERCEIGATSDTQATYLAVDDTDVVGMGVGLRRPQRSGATPQDALVIVSVYMNESYRGSGVSDLLMGEIEQWGRSWGAPVSTLWVTETNHRAAAFYRRIGYRQTGDRKRTGADSDLFEVRLQKSL